MSSKKILIVGGSSFIGRNIKESFLSAKYEIHSPTSKELNLIDDQSVASYFKKNDFDFIIHSAVKPGHRNSKDLTNQLYSNTRMFYNLITHSDRWDKMIFLGSGSVYSASHYLPKMKEDYYGTHIPLDEHGFSKYLVRRYIEKSSNIVDLVIFSIFGKYEDWAIRFISNLLCKGMYDLPLTMKKNRKFDFIYVKDLVPVIDHFLQNNWKHTSYNVTPDESVYLYDLAQTIRQVVNKDLPIIVREEGLDLEYSGDNSRLKAEMPSYKNTPFSESIPELYNWYCENKHLIDRNLLLTDK